MKSQSDSMSGRARPSSGDMRPAERRQDAGSPPMREAEEKREVSIAVAISWPEGRGRWTVSWSRRVGSRSKLTHSARCSTGE